MIVDGQTQPTTSQLAALTTEGATQMGCLESQMLTSVVSAGLAKWQIVWNVTQSNATGNVSPVTAVSLLFGDNTKFTAFVDKAIALGLVPSLTEPMATGQELEGVPIGTTPPTAPSSPTTPSAPATPTLSPISPPSTTTPSSTPTHAPVATPPTGQLGPTSAAPGREEKLVMALIAVFTVVVILLCKV